MSKDAVLPNEHSAEDHDGSDRAGHHTLGTYRFQASPGNHTHSKNDPNSVPIFTGIEVEIDPTNPQSQLDQIWELLGEYGVKVVVGYVPPTIVVPPGYDFTGAEYFRATYLNDNEILVSWSFNSDVEINSQVDGVIYNTATNTVSEIKNLLTVTDDYFDTLFPPSLVTYESFRFSNVLSNGNILLQVERVHSYGDGSNQAFDWVLYNSDLTVLLDDSSKYYASSNDYVYPRYFAGDYAYAARNGIAAGVVQLRIWELGQVTTTLPAVDVTNYNNNTGYDAAIAIGPEGFSMAVYIFTDNDNYLYFYARAQDSPVRYYNGVVKFVNGAVDDSTVVTASEGYTVPTSGTINYFNTVGTLDTTRFLLLNNTPPRVLKQYSLGSDLSIAHLGDSPSFSFGTYGFIVDSSPTIQLVVVDIVAGTISLNGTEIYTFDSTDTIDYYLATNRKNQLTWVIHQDGAPPLLGRHII